jgi:hypothetical protein
LNPEPAHDFQQAGVVGKPELLGRLRHVPVVAFQRLHDDLALGFELLFFEGAWCVGERASCVVRRA